MKKVFLLLFLCCISIYAHDKKVLIIGGGPAGLSTAIEAKLQGYDVSVVEKREKYTREQWLFLIDSSLKLLEKWNIDTSDMNTTEIRPNFRVGFVPIKRLEKRLEKRAKELGVQKICGAFSHLTDHAATITTPEKTLNLSYDILVGADGTHSAIRDALGIEMNPMGTACGTTAIISYENSATVEVSPPIKTEEGFIRRILVPPVSVVFTHSPKEVTRRQLRNALASQGWDVEAAGIESEQTPIATNIPILLQQVRAFSKPEKAAILIGEAAASASFFKGMGANTAIKCAAIAGQFFQEIEEQNKSAYRNYEHAMKEATDALIQDSAFLFN